MSWVCGSIFPLVKFYNFEISGLLTTITQKSISQGELFLINSKENLRKWSFAKYYPRKM